MKFFLRHTEHHISGGKLPNIVLATYNPVTGSKDGPSKTFDTCDEAIKELRDSFEFSVEQFPETTDGNYWRSEPKWSGSSFTWYERVFEKGTHHLCVHTQEAVPLTANSCPTMLDRLDMSPIKPGFKRAKVRDKSSFTQITSNVS